MSEIKPQEKRRCCQKIWDNWHSHQCSRNAKVERDGLWYCGTHDPVAVASKNKARDEKWEAERIAERAKWARQDAEHRRATECTDACIGIESPAEAIQAAKLALEEVIASARPHPTDNPTMYAAWGKAAAALRLLQPNAPTK